MVLLVTLPLLLPPFPFVRLELVELVVSEVVTCLVDEPGVLGEEIEALDEETKVLDEVVMSVAGYDPPLLPEFEDVLLDSTAELVPKIRELRLLNMPPVLEDEATG
ncbi:hypothetical protein RRF57_005266 [Xylaria bambusicola]|uniref:Uncharacterized protein n=1 Tax=Xylaria bambusicola TaxID=326684 RepID=A0AAN7UN87_9PEZI